MKRIRRARGDSEGMELSPLSEFTGLTPEQIETLTALRAEHPTGEDLQFEGIPCWHFTKDGDCWLRAIKRDGSTEDFGPMPW